RHTLAILVRRGLDAYVAQDAADYVALAARLADPEERAEARRLIAERRPLLFGDLEPIRALEGFFVRALSTVYGVEAAGVAA
ncbi:hypothetical protein J8J40_33080, partial [Mycobacterium tuberculosis]|nr:hypothetical protein [Mycobacterium tuberculosis]